MVTPSRRIVGHLGTLPAISGSDAYRDQIGHFADVLHGRAEPLIGYADGVTALVLAEACGWSARHQQVFTLPNENPHA